MNYLSDLIKKDNFSIINFNNIDLNINWQKDLYNNAHLNTCGATKFTKYFSKYLNDTYHLPNHKNDKNYESWKIEYDRLKNDYYYLAKENWDALLNRCSLKEE